MPSLPFSSPAPAAIWAVVSSSFCWRVGSEKSSQARAIRRNSPTLPPKVPRRAQWTSTIRSLLNAFSGVDRLLLISTDALDRPGRRLAQHRAAVAAAVKAGVKHVVYTSMPNPEPGSRVIFAPDHYGTEQALKESGLSWTILRNAWYAENLAFTLPAALATGKWITSAGEGRIPHIARDDCAEAAAAALASPSTDNARYDITGPEALTTIRDCGARECSFREADRDCSGERRGAGHGSLSRRLSRSLRSDVRIVRCQRARGRIRPRQRRFQAPDRQGSTHASGFPGRQQGECSCLRIEYAALHGRPLPKVGIASHCTRRLPLRPEVRRRSRPNARALRPPHAHGHGSRAHRCRRRSCIP